LAHRGEQEDTGDHEELGDHGEANVEDGITLVDYSASMREVSKK